MVYGAGGSEAAIYAAIAQAVKASGVIVHVEPDDFIKILTRAKDPLVVTAKGGAFKKNYQYLTGYKGLAFFTKAPEPLMLPGGAEVVSAKQIWIPA
jgi:hypothetical protein